MKFVSRPTNMIDRHSPVDVDRQTDESNESHYNVKTADITGGVSNE